MVRDGDVDLCTENPGKDVDLYINSTVRNLVQVWEGDVGIKTALRKRLLNPQGNTQLARTMPNWLGINLYADIRPGDPAMMQMAADEET